MSDNECGGSGVSLSLPDLLDRLNAEGREGLGIALGEAPHMGQSWLAVGIVGSLAAFHVYGLKDAIALGAKPGMALRMLLAPTPALWSVLPGPEPSSEPKIT